MARLKWTPQAVEDIEAICEFISRDSFEYARLFASDIILAVRRLESFPQSGRVVPELSNLSIQEIILGNYRIIYRVNQEMVEILTVHHSAKLLNPEDF